MSGACPIARENAAIIAAAHAALSTRPKAISPTWLYDPQGSALFEDITGLPEYYPTRAEIALFEAHAAQMVAGVAAGCVVVEWGSGSSRKTPLILAALERPALYAPIDVSPAALDPAAARIAKAFPGVKVRPVLADFAAPFALPPEVAGARGPRLGFFPGSTIGNFSPEDATVLLRRAGALLGAGARFLVGVDTPKDEAALVAAYDDAAGVTAAFNLNLLARLNREAGADFDLARFRHEARWNAALSRVEMHLVSLAAQSVRLDGRIYHFAAGESLHTENSYKYAPAAVAALARGAGWRVEAQWLARGDAFGVYRLALD